MRAADPDLLIRTSGEMRVSNFLLWQIAYAEIFVTETLWPDFNRPRLLEAFVEFQSATGATVASAKARNRVPRVQGCPQVFKLAAPISFSSV